MWSLNGGPQDPVPTAWKAASKDRVKFDPQSRIRNRKLSSPSPRVRARLRQ
jgi:hypothetical protein